MPAGFAASSGEVLVHSLQQSPDFLLLLLMTCCWGSTHHSQPPAVSDLLDQSKAVLCYGPAFRPAFARVDIPVNAHQI